MAEIVSYFGMAIAFLGAIFGKIVMAAAVAHLQAAHPAVFDEFATGRSLLGLPTAREHSARRALARKLLAGALPAPLSDDPQLATFRQQWRGAVAAMAGGLALAILAIVQG